MTKKSPPQPPRLWLASGSPRRAQLLDWLGIPYTVVVSNAEEAELFEGTVEATVVENALRKAKTVAVNTPPADIVLAADTLVAQGERVISKPVDRAEALSNLRAFSGTQHRVLTGLVLVSGDLGISQTCVQTQVWFRKLSEAEMESYADTAEPYDKAGGYGIQGLGCLFVDRIEGSYSNVMGLPTETLLRELSRLSGLTPFQWFAK